MNSPLGDSVRKTFDIMEPDFKGNILNSTDQNNIFALNVIEPKSKLIIHEVSNFEMLGDHSASVSEGCYKHLPSLPYWISRFLKLFNLGPLQS